MRVLVVDDDASIRALVETTLDDFEVSTASDGAGALEFLESNTVDVVLLDVMMPGMDGFEVLGRIRRSAKLSELPVVLLTAKTSEADHVRGFRAGADAYVTKPFDVDTLADDLRAITGKSPGERAERRKDELEKAELLRQIEQRFAAF